LYLGQHIGWYVLRTILDPVGTKEDMGNSNGLPDLVSGMHHLLVAARGRGATEFVFPSHSKSGYIAEPKFFLRRVAQECGVEVSVHDLRRTFATVAAEMKDANTLAINALLNHSLGRDVTSGYVHFSPERLRAEAEKVCQEMMELCEVEPIAGENVKSLR